MKFNKLPLSLQQQVDLLIKRGLITEPSLLIKRLKFVNYYRLSGYWFPFKNRDNSFKPNTTFEKVWRRYTFDRQLRCLVIDAIERVEIAVRTAIVYNFVHKYGAFGYKNSKNLPGISKFAHQKLLKNIDSLVSKSKETFVQEFKENYGNVHNNMMPLWMVSELMSFGSIFTFFRGLSKKDKIKISDSLNINYKVLTSWLSTLNYIRNTCAHHSRLWNRKLAVKPLIPNNNIIWQLPVKIKGDYIFGTLTILKYLLNFVAEQSNWSNRLTNLLENYNDIPLKPMGFPENWKDSPIWNEK